MNSEADTRARVLVGVSPDARALLKKIVERKKIGAMVRVTQQCVLNDIIEKTYNEGN